MNIQFKKDTVGPFVRFIEMFICPPLDNAPKGLVELEGLRFIVQLGFIIEGVEWCCNFT